ncbi:MAG: MerR family transcriptional regulator [Sulfitobacter sp.]
MRIGELAVATNVSTDTLRFYEKRGLIHSQRRANGYRDFHEETVQLVEIIRLGKSLGFNLREMTELSHAMSQDNVNEQETAEILAQKLAETDQRILSLQQLRKTLSAAILRNCPIRKLSKRP